MELNIDPITLPQPNEAENKVPDKTEFFKNYKEETGKDYILDKAEELFKNYQGDPENTAKAITEIAKLIVCHPQYTVQDAYAEDIGKKYKKTRPLKQEVAAIREAAFSEDNNSKFTPEDDTDYETLADYGFYIESNQYIFQNKSNDFKPGTNFIIEPLFHIYTKAGGDANKRLIRIRNVYDRERIVDVPSQTLVSPDKFQGLLFEEGNYLIYCNKLQFLKILSHISNKFPVCHELGTLGWQHEGFYAFANGIFSPSEGYRDVDEYGITKHKNEHYFSPAFSSVYKDVRADEDQYENDRNFIFTKSKISFNEWSDLMQKVYDQNGMLAVAFTIASMFRSYIYNVYKIFPHIFFFGEKGSGKSQLGWSISNVFMKNMQPFNLNAGTDVAFFRRLGRFRDSVVWFDEFTNNIDEKRFQALKSAYDGVGREKGKLSRDSRTEVDKVNAACAISGQYLPTRDDNALYTRSVVCTVEKKKYTNEATRNFDKLKEHETEGLSSVITEVMTHRSVFEKYYTMLFQDIFDRMKRTAKDNAEYFEERILRNYTILVTSVRIVEEKTPLSTGIKWQELEKICYKMAIDQCDKISSSDALAGFWNMVEFLLDTQQIHNFYDFEIVPAEVISVMTSRTQVEEKRIAKPGKLKDVLYIRLNRVHPLYMTEFRKQNGEKGLELSSLKDYIKYHKAYLGVCKTHKFENTNTSALMFDYDQIGINLRRESKPQNPN